MAYVEWVSEYKFLPKLKTRLDKLDIELTERCNNNCVHCYINMPQDSLCQKDEMPTKTILEIINQAADMGCMNIFFTGGEPLLRADFEEIYIYTRKKGITIRLYTNARNITPEKAKLFKAIPPGKLISITAYGISEESYDKVALCKGAYKEFMQGLNNLSNEGIPFHLKHVVLPDNKHELYKFEEWSKKIKCRETSLVPIMIYYLRGRGDSESKNNLIRGLRISPEEIASNFCSNMKYNEDMISLLKRCGYVNNKLFSCGFGKGISIDPYGNMQGCLLLRDPNTCFNVKEYTLEDVLTNVYPEVCKLEVSNQEHLEKCSKCFIRTICEQCPAKSYMENGTLDTPVKYFCDITHNIARKIGALKENEFAYEVNDWRQRLENL